jgi:hypothetical protein
MKTTCMCACLFVFLIHKPLQLAGILLTHKPHTFRIYVHELSKDHDSYIEEFNDNYLTCFGFFSK